MQFFSSAQGNTILQTFWLQYLKKTWKRRKALIKRYDKQKGKKQKNEV